MVPLRKRSVIRSRPLFWGVASGEAAGRVDAAGRDRPHRAVQPGGAPTPLGNRLGPDDQAATRQPVQVFANRIGMLTNLRRQGCHGAGLGLVDQSIQNGGLGGGEMG